MNWYSFKSAIVKWFGDIKVYPYPMFIMFGHSAYKMKGPDVRSLIDTIQPGDIVLRRYDHYLSGLMIPGYWTHSSIYVGNNKIIHMLGGGITKEDILTFTRCDNVLVLRKAHSVHGVTIQEAITMAENFYESKIEYDFGFKEGSDLLYCSEFSHVCYGKPPISKPLLKKGLILPDDQTHYIDFNIVWTKST